jgi:hypothetical protein
VISAKGTALSLVAKGASFFGVSAFAVDKTKIMEIATKSVALRAPGLSDQTPFLARMKCFLDNIDFEKMPPLSKMIFNNTLTGFMQKRLQVYLFFALHFSCIFFILSFPSIYVHILISPSKS